MKRILLFYQSCFQLGTIFRLLMIATVASHTQKEAGRFQNEGKIINRMSERSIWISLIKITFWPNVRKTVALPDIKIGTTANSSQYSIQLCLLKKPILFHSHYGNFDTSNSYAQAIYVYWVCFGEHNQHEWTCKINLESTANNIFGGLIRYPVRRTTTINSLAIKR